MLNKNVEIKRAQLREGFKLKFQSWKQRLPYKSWTKDLFILLYFWDFSFFQTYISEFIHCYNRIRTRKKKEDEYLYLAEFSFFFVIIFLCLFMHTAMSICLFFMEHTSLCGCNWRWSYKTKEYLSLFKMKIFIRIIKIMKYDFVWLFIDRDVCYGRLELGFFEGNKAVFRKSISNKFYTQLKCINNGLCQ